MREPTERLRDILEAIAHIERYVVRGRESFDRDELVQVWMLHYLQLIGEAARSLPVAIQERAVAIPWSEIIGMRHILVHSYFEIDTLVVWNAVIDDLPALKRQVEMLLAQIEQTTDVNEQSE